MPYIEQQFRQNRKSAIINIVASSFAILANLPVFIMPLHFLPYILIIINSASFLRSGKDNILTYKQQMKHKSIATIVIALIHTPFIVILGTFYWGIAVFSGEAFSNLFIVSFLLMPLISMLSLLIIFISTSQMKDIIGDEDDWILEKARQEPIGISQGIFTPEEQEDK